MFLAIISKIKVGEMFVWVCFFVLLANKSWITHC